MLPQMVAGAWIEYTQPAMLRPLAFDRIRSHTVPRDKASPRSCIWREDLPPIARGSRNLTEWAESVPFHTCLRGLKID